MIRRSSLALLFAFVFSSGELRAETKGTADLPTAERAYREIDFERARRIALEALQRGGHAVATTARLHKLLGLTNATLGRRDDAYEAFVVLLALDPQLKLERELSPKLRGPYLEARGFWASLSRPFELREGGSTADVLAFDLSDPIGLVDRVRVVLRGTPERTFELAPTERPTVPLTREERRQAFAYEVTLLDARRNAVYTITGLKRAAAVPGQRRASAERVQRDPSLYHLTGGILGGLGVASSIAGMVFHLERERRAREWNGESCERPGATRGQQCARVDAARLDAQRWAVGAYAAGGALLIGGAVTLLSAPRGDTDERGRASAARACLPWHLGLACELRF